MPDALGSNPSSAPAAALWETASHVCKETPTPPNPSFSDCNWLLMWKSIPVRSGPLSALQSCQNHYDPKTHPVLPEGSGFCQGEKRERKEGWRQAGGGVGAGSFVFERCLYMCDGRLSFCWGLYCMLASIFHLLLPVIWCQCGKCRD